jgi:hypothetical protein
MSPVNIPTDYYRATHEPEVPSPHEELARLRKAIRLVLFLLAHGYGSEHAERMNSQNWSQVASLAGVRPPSTSIPLVIELLKELEALKESA